MDHAFGLSRTSPYFFGSVDPEIDSQEDSNNLKLHIRAKRLKNSKKNSQASRGRKCTSKKHQKLQDENADCLASDGLGKSSSSGGEIGDTIRIVLATLAICAGVLVTVMSLTLKMEMDELMQNYPHIFPLIITTLFAGTAVALIFPSKHALPSCSSQTLDLEFGIFTSPKPTTLPLQATPKRTKTHNGIASASPSVSLSPTIQEEGKAESENEVSGLEEGDRWDEIFPSFDGHMDPDDHLQVNLALASLSLSLSLLYSLSHLQASPIL